MKRLLTALLLLGPLYGLAACGKETTVPGNPAGTDQTPGGGNNEPDGSVYRIRITVAGNALTANLDDNTTVKDFVSLLPMTVNMTDFAGAEKIFYLPRKLSTDVAEAGVRPVTGDIAYYAPWGNIAVFYNDAAYSSSLYRIGTVVGGIGAFSTDGDINNVTIELLETNK